MKEVFVVTRKKRKFSFIVDDEDFERVSNELWHLENGYPVCVVIINDLRKRLKIHQYILGKYCGVCDHKDRNKLNNQKDNLRICTQKQNSRNRSIQRGNKTGYKGIHLVKRINSYRVMISIDDKTFHVGYRKNIIDAAKLYNDAAIKHYGEFAKLNAIP